MQKVECFMCIKKLQNSCTQIQTKPISIVELIVWYKVLKKH
jgi:hypothetical protein